ncbi:Ig-like domain-containing protein [Dyadobacter sandarakinus]|uniref:Ig-like domain-containing protein n=1 Tax=Dyadobacter sandarakinus TaxID=2747268 RepID=A0ABX7I0L9_9BACT|nr:hypothetical protein [Dyadobacter sandarakinus]QRQ99543.1 hypothetical protein HWI92_00745 [Dyadobacter sandarakinus]
MYSRCLARFFAALLVVLVYTGTCLAQPANAVYADKQTNGGQQATVGSYSVTNPDNARNTAGNVKPNDNFALLDAGSTLGISKAWIQLEFPNEITSSAASPATAYVRINNNNNALTTSGAITVTAYDKNGNAVALVSNEYAPYYTPDGSVFVALSPTASYKSVRITVATSVLLGSISLQVYYAFYGPQASNVSNPYPFSVSDCGKPNVSTKGSSGGLNLGTFDVSNAGNAIDESTSTRSSFVATGLSLLSGHIKQTFFFNGPSNAADAVRFILSQSGSFLAVNLGNSLTLQAYNGSTLVGSAQLVASLLDADLLGLLGTNNTQAAFYFSPKDAVGNPVVFDRVELDLNIGTLGLALGSNGVNIHDVRRAPDVPNASNVKACTNIGTAALAALAPQAGIAGIGSFTYRWYDSVRSGTLLTAQANWTATGLNTAGERTYYAEIQKSGSGCIVSPRKKVTVTVVAPPVSPGVALTP